MIPIVKSLPQSTSSSSTQNKFIHIQATFKGNGFDYFFQLFTGSKRKGGFHSDFINKKHVDLLIKYQDFCIT